MTLLARHQYVGMRIAQLAFYEQAGAPDGWMGDGGKQEDGA